MDLPYRRNSWKINNKMQKLYDMWEVITSNFLFIASTVSGTSDFALINFFSIQVYNFLRLKYFTVN